LLILPICLLLCCQENPKANKVLGVFGLSLYTDERALQDIFGKFGRVAKVTIIQDRQVGVRRIGGW